MGHMSPRLKARRGRFGDAGFGPNVNILSPSNGASFAANNGSPLGSPLLSSIVFTGTSIDDEDGDISSGIVWTSDVDGTLGTGATIGTGSPLVFLSLGAHVITATSTAPTGSPLGVGTDVINITVTTV